MRQPSRILFIVHAQTLDIFGWRGSVGFVRLQVGRLSPIFEIQERDPASLRLQAGQANKVGVVLFIKVGYVCTGSILL